MEYFDNDGFAKYYLASLLTEDEEVVRITTMEGNRFFLIMKKGSTDIHGAMEETLHRILDAQEQELKDADFELEHDCGIRKMPESRDDDDLIHIDGNYIFEEHPVECIPTDVNYIRFAVYGAYLAECEKEKDPLMVYLAHRYLSSRDTDAVPYPDFIAGDYRNSYTVKGLMDGLPERMYELYLDDAFPGRLSRQEARAFVEDLVKKEELPVLMTNEGDIIYEPWEEHYISREKFADFVCEHPEYAKLLKKSPAKG